MTCILIEEWTDGPRGTNARVRFDGGPVYPTTIRDPFTPEQEQQLAWYFEEHWYTPLIKQARANEAAASITIYGETLFNQVFADRRIYAAYAHYRAAGINSLQFEIAGSFTFHSLHWEALKDPDLPHPFVLDATMVRKNLASAPIAAIIRPSPTINILVVTARPTEQNDAGYRTISRPMVESLRQSHFPVQIDLVRPGTYAALSHHLDTVRNTHGAGYYHVIHFDVHGQVLTYEQLKKKAESGLSRSLLQKREGFDRHDIQPYVGERAFLFLEEAQNGQSDAVAATELAKLLLKHQIPIALLNACQSGKLPLAEDVGGTATQRQIPSTIGDTRESSLGLHLMQAGVQMILAMSYSVMVSTASLLMAVLYQQLFEGKTLAVAIRMARMALANQKAREATFHLLIDLEDWLLPVVYQNQEVQIKVRSFTLEEERLYLEQQVKRYQEPATPYGFFGRDLDVLAIERHLLIDHNLLLVRGKEGVGKTTLLHHLGAWWQTTHLVNQVLYFGYDKRTWSRQVLIKYIVQQLVGKECYRCEFQSLSLDAQHVKLTSLLRATRHLLILDNLESITRTHFIRQHTRSTKEQEALRRLLTDLSGGKTLVLLGSQSDEAWLAQGTFAQNVYDLKGLDAEAASQLTERILKQYHATQYLHDRDLRHLLQRLDGFPRALENELAKLVYQTPTELLSTYTANNH